MTEAGRPSRKIPLLFVITLIVIAGCAKSVYPPGGPPDTVPPVIVSTIPASGSVRVATDVKIEIEFSETIDRRSVTRAIFITPQPDPEPKIKIAANKVTITPRQPLKPDKTYLISIGTDLRDAHSVNLAQSLNLAFSTGTTIDTGVIAGLITKEGRPARAVNVALFESPPEDLAAEVDSLRPDYITQSGDDGRYAFSFIPPNEYYLVAFSDDNKNRRINPGREMFGLPFRPLVIDSAATRLENVDVRLEQQEGGIVGIRSIVRNADGLLKVRFNASLNRDQARTVFESAILRPFPDSSQTLALGTYGILGPYPTSDFVAIVPDLQIGTEYSFTFDRRLLYPGIADSLRYMTFAFIPGERPDVSPPSLVLSRPNNGEANVEPDSLFRFVFIEPTDPALVTGAIRLAGDGGDTQTVIVSPVDDFTYEGSAPSALDFGSTYTLLLDGRRFVDGRGNALSDSLVSIGFTTIGRDTLGLIIGQIQYGDSRDAVHPVALTFTPAGQGVSRTLLLQRGQIDFRAALLPGYYTVSAFLDRNDNGLFDVGSIIPYQLAEPFTAPTDTIRVRARFESTDVVIEL